MQCIGQCKVSTSLLQDNNTTLHQTGLLQAWYRHHINMQTTLQALHRPKLIYRLFIASGRPVNFLISRSETGLNGRTGLLQAVYKVKQDVYRLVTIQFFIRVISVMGTASAYTYSTDQKIFSVINISTLKIKI